MRWIAIRILVLALFAQLLDIGTTYVGLSQYGFAEQNGSVVRGIQDTGSVAMGLLVGQSQPELLGAAVAILLLILVKSKWGGWLSPLVVPLAALVFLKNLFNLAAALSNISLILSQRGF